MRVSEPARAGVGGQLVRKPTRWASFAPELLKRVGLWCTNEGLQPQDPPDGASATSWRVRGRRPSRP
eukprot:6477689-Alexandrium_andersonii.AAC.1